jgi:hypothetical protein
MEDEMVNDECEIENQRKKRLSTRERRGVVLW